MKLYKIIVNRISMSYNFKLLSNVHILKIKSYRYTSVRSYLFLFWLLREYNLFFNQIVVVKGNSIVYLY